MTSTAALAALLALVVAAPSAELRIVDVDPLLRGGVLLRCRIQRAVAADEAAIGPCTLALAIDQEGRRLAASELRIERLGQLREGVVAVLLPETPAGPAAARLAVTLTGPGQVQLGSGSTAIETPGAARAELDALYARLKDEREPQPRLWLEQGAGLVAEGGTWADHLALRAIIAALGAWSAGERPSPRPGAAFTGAARDPVDGSVQPWRLHLPTAAGDTPLRVVCVLDAPEGAPSKHRWPGAPADWIEAARAAGLAVVECYPSGDLAWTGAALRRVAPTLAAAARARPGLDVDRVLLLARRGAAAGAVALAERGLVAAAGLVVVDGSLPPAAATRPGNAVMPVACAGARDPALRAWLDRRMRSGAQLHREAAPASPAFWTAFAHECFAAAAPPAGERELDGPGRWDDIVVEQLTDVGRPAVLQRLPDGGIATINVARLRLDPEPARRPLVDGRPYAPPPPEHGRAKRLGQACGPLAGYATGPFAIVIGTGENMVAPQANRALARDFLVAWVAHAQGAPPVIDDVAADAAALAGRHLVLIGNPRSNGVLRRMVEAGLDLPAVWDARSVRVGGQEFARAERRPVALCWPHPALDGRLLVVLDGAPAWAPPPAAGGAGLPLAGLPDLVVGEPDGRRQWAVERLFDSWWK